MSFSLSVLRYLKRNRLSAFIAGSLLVLILMTFKHREFSGSDTTSPTPGKFVGIRISRDLADARDIVTARLVDTVYGVMVYARAVCGKDSNALPSLTLVCYERNNMWERLSEP